MAIRWFHPRTAKLRSYLERGGMPRVERHVESCQRCADRLESLDSVTVRPALRTSLADLLQPPADLSDRVHERVTAAEAGDPELRLFAGLFAIGVDTARLMLPPVDRTADQTVTDLTDPTEGLET